MAFFDEVGKKIAQTSQGVAQKTKNMAETVKLNGMISDEEKRISNAFLQIGKTYYETYGGNPDQLFAQLIAGINDSKAKIGSYQEQVKQLKGIVRCSKCGGEVPYGAPFCSSCGVTMNVAPSAPDGSIFCGKCGSSVAPGKVFCTNCGGKIEQATTPAAVPAPPPEPVYAPTPPVQEVSEVVPPAATSIQCPGCGSELAANAVFCLNCGQKIGD
jgi:membrane protease subunit (stomatin/prohibitin family)